MASGEQVDNPQWQRKLIETLSLESLKEQRRRRRWGILFKLLLFIYLFALLGLTLWRTDLSGEGLGGSEHTARVDLVGLIADGGESSADGVMKGLQRAFEDEMTKGVVLYINSPGGSPVQSDLIYREIKRLRQAHEAIPLYAVITDIGASGAYYIAAAADKIYVNPSSLVGSIGVLMNGFGFTAAMDKLGIERRLLTAGEHKGGLDPFSPLEEQAVTHIQQVLDDIHTAFIDSVKQGRGDRLRQSEALFSGRIWSGRRAIELGLVDEIGDLHKVAREVVGVEKIVNFTPEEGLLTRFADRLGAAIAATVVQPLQQTTLY